MSKKRNLSTETNSQEKDLPAKVSGSGVVGTQNDARLKLYDSIADNAEEARQDEVNGVEDTRDPSQKTSIAPVRSMGTVLDVEDEEEEQNPSVSPDSEEERAEVADDDDPDTDQVDKTKTEPRMITRKVNGKDVTLTEEQWLDRATKVEAADQYLAEASKVYKASQPSVKDTEAEVEEDDLALARAIQMGSEEEAVNAIRKLKPRPSSRDDLARIVDERLTFQKAYGSYRDKYKELFADPLLEHLVTVEDDKLVNANFVGTYEERWDKAAQAVLEWKGKLAGAPAVTDKILRKATVTPIRSASSRAVDSGDQEPDDNPTSVIEQMAASRRGHKAA